MSKEQVNKDLINLYIQNKKDIDAYSNEIFNKHRDASFKAFMELDGIPDKSNEKYKYTDLTEVFAKDYSVTFKPIELEIDTESVFKCDVVKLDADIFLMSRGRFIEKEKLTTAENGIIVGSIAEAAKKYPEIIEKHYNKYANVSGDSLTALNTMMAQDGIFIYFPKGAENEKPIQIVNLLLDDEGFFYNTRNLIIVEDNAKANIVFCDDSLSVKEFLGNNVSEIYIGENASLDYYRIQNEHTDNNNISSIYIHQSKYSRLNSGVYSLLGGVIRNNFDIQLKGEGCESELYGLSLIDKNQHIDNNVFVNHSSAHCNSKQLFKAIVDDNASGAFSGKVLVSEGAQQTNAEQTSKNILLTNDAKMNTMPQLVIYADDVKCSHGATVGQLDEDAMFYMRARGIEEKEAKRLLMYAFASEVIKPIKIEALRENIEDLAQKRLNGELAICRNCSARVIK